MKIKKLLVGILASTMMFSTISVSAQSVDHLEEIKSYSYSIMDVTNVQKIIVGMLECTDYNMDIYDVNFDGQLSVDDATQIQKHCAGFFDINSSEYREQFTITIPAEESASIQSTVVPTDFTEKAITPETTMISTTQSGPTYIRLNKDTLKLGINETFLLKLESDSDNYAAIFTSSNQSVAVVDNSGNINAKHVGTTIITCTTNNGLSTNCKVTVGTEAKSLKLSNETLTMGIGETYDLDSFVNSGAAAYFRYYSSNNEDIATVACSGGLVTAKSTGTTEIVCTLENGVKATCVVTVKEMADSLSLNENKITVGLGETFDFDSYAPKDTAAYRRDYYSEDTSIVKIAKAGGLMTTVNTGNTRIYCELANGVRVYAEVTVKEAPSTVKISHTSTTLKVGNSVTLTESTNSGSYAKSFSWNTSNDKVVKIIKTDKNNASIKAMSLGTANITIKTYNGKTATCKVTVSGSDVKCIDVSTWQGNNIDFNKVKASGIDYVIIRAGYGREISQKDDKFENNYKKAKAAGLKVGVYWFSYAMSPSEAFKEADACLYCLDGKALDLPVYYDMEYAPAITQLSSSNYTKMATNFCDTIKNSGYSAGVYASASVYDYPLNYNVINKNYSVWNAEWNSYYTLDCDVWQYSSSGIVDGINGNVDMNMIYNLNIVK